MYFYPRSPCGERRSTLHIILISIPFLSTLSLRRATLPTCAALTLKRYFYPRSPCGERPNQSYCCRSYMDFYPRSPCGERPVLYSVNRWTTRISIHALLAESDPRQYSFDQRFAISIHALLAESDFHGLHLTFERTDFYPRSPCGERPVLYSVNRWTTRISIHALLAESDCSDWFACFSARYFYPRSPCGERQFQMLRQARHMQFLSTLSLRRATPGERHASTQQEFLSTLSLRRATAAGVLPVTLII